MTTLKFTVLPTPNKEFFKLARKIITQFIWGTKPPKIAYHTLTHTIAQGGLKLTDLQIKESALKISWVKKALTQEQMHWKNVASELLPIGIPEILGYNIHKEDLKVDKNYPSLWVSVLRAWSKINYIQTPENQQILLQNLWWNSHIRRDGKPMLNKNMFDKGIKFVKDIYNPSSRTLHTFETLQQCYGRVGNYLDYFALIKAIPKNWLAELRLDPMMPQDIENHLLRSVHGCSKAPKWAYLQIQEKEATPLDGARLKWENNLGISIPMEKWEQLRTQAFKIAKSTKLKDFQFRLLSGKITTNILRAKWTPTISPLCTFCKQQNETLMHIFVNCQHTKKLWSALQKWLEYQADFRANIQPQDIILNDYKGPQKEFVNTCILVLKQLIYAKKCKQERPLLIEGLRKLHELYIDEKFIAQQKGKKMYEKHQKKWSIYIKTTV